MTEKKIAIFASGEGTNAQSIIDHFRNSAGIKIVLIVSNRPEAKVLDRAKKEGIPALVIDRKMFYESDSVVSHLQNAGIDLVVLAGFLWMIPGNLVKAFPDRIVNIHPALLPKFGGKGMYGMNVHKAVVAAGEKESGISIHFVNEQYDEGKIISQHCCPVDVNDSPEQLARKIQQLEHTFFPKVIEKLLGD
ncbi:MAG: phosphoribosylglycinamide formyltransferase [Bacteroidia bacterium]